MEWMEKLKHGLERVEHEGIEALTSVQAEAMSFFCTAGFQRLGNLGLW